MVIFCILLQSITNIRPTLTLSPSMWNNSIFFLSIFPLLLCVPGDINRPEVLRNFDVGAARACVFAIDDMTAINKVWRER